MWIFLGIVSFLAATITALLLTPINVIIKTDETGKIQMFFKIFHKTFGEEPSKPNDSVGKIIKRSLGIFRFEGKELKQTVEKKGLTETVTATCHLLFSLIEEIIKLLKRVTVKKLYIDVFATGEDAAKTAINYGLCCAAVYPICGLVNSKLRVKEGAQKINISSGFEKGEGHFACDIIMSVRASTILARIIKLVWAEAVRTVKSGKNISR